MNELLHGITVQALTAWKVLGYVKHPAKENSSTAAAAAAVWEKKLMVGKVREDQRQERKSIFHPRASFQCIRKDRRFFLWDYTLTHTHTHQRLMYGSMSRGEEVHLKSATQGDLNYFSQREDRWCLNGFTASRGSVSDVLKCPRQARPHYLLVGWSTFACYSRAFFQCCFILRRCDQY